MDQVRFFDDLSLGLYTGCAEGVYLLMLVSILPG